MLSHLKDSVDLSFVLGVEVQRVNQSLVLHQNKSILDLLSKPNMIEANPTPILMVGFSKLTQGEREPFVDVHLYKQIVGALQYVCLTRPDIGYSVIKMS